MPAPATAPNYHFKANAKLEQMEKDGKLPKPTGPLPDHYKNFLNACYGIESTNTPFEIGAPLAELLCLGCIGQRFGGTLKYDGKAMKITNNTEANKMLYGPTVRSEWTSYDKQQPSASKASRIKSPDQVQWEPLFKDSSLSNWENPYEWGDAEYKDGIVTLSSKKSKWFFVTKKTYANFVFEGEIKMPVDEGNSGFMFRCQKDKNRVWGYQAEVDTADRKWSGGLYDEARRMWFASPNRDHAANDLEKQQSIAAFRARAGECYKQGQWNKYRIECIGDHIRIFVNDVLTTDVYDGMDLEGHIGIQHHGETKLSYQFRNLRIKDLGTGGNIYYPHREKADIEKAASMFRGMVYEAEDAILEGCRISMNYMGYRGKGYVDFGRPGSSLLWNNVKVSQDGSYSLTFRYASRETYPCDLYVNDKRIAQIPFEATIDLSNWKTVDMKATLKKGVNSIKVVSLVSTGPNLDAMAVNPTQ